MDASLAQTGNMVPSPKYSNDIGMLEFNSDPSHTTYEYIRVCYFPNFDAKINDSPFDDIWSTPQLATGHKL